jgi:16S rRNA (guanine527-N7)-methyltransferase
VEEELTAADRDWAMTVTRVPSQTAADGVVLRLSDLRRR